MAAVAYFIEKALRKRARHGYFTRVDNYNEFYVTRTIAHFDVFI